MLAYQTVGHSTLTPVYPMISKAKKGTYPDEPVIIEALIIPQYEQWNKYTAEEITNLLKRETWDVIQKSEIPEESKIIICTWDFKCKRFPDGSFQKFKTRFCIRGDIQKRLSDMHMNNYDPVVQWSTVMLMLLLTCITGLKTQSTKFSNDFYRDELKQPVYLQPPAKYSDASWGDNPILWLNKSLYGQSEAPRLWYKKLKKGLEKHGFTPRKVDPCMLISKTVICVKYVDNFLWLYHDQKELEKVLQPFRDDGDKTN